MLRDPFFAGPGLDRADALRARPEQIADLARRADARELVWADGLPAVDDGGALIWGPVARPDLFLGLAGGAPCFTAIPEKAEGSRASP